ncbi:MAG TPA: 50S ribosomal protein L1 [Candidatus Saccharimonadales bacterium]|nr:50S ribosomal protein L1 [Candidatus Saccharimonadales bacterium]
MAKSKTILLEEAKSMGLEVTDKNTVAEITAAIAAMSQTPVEPVETGNLVVAEAGEVVQAEEAKAAKSGKRSEKGQKEAAEKQAKVEAQHHREDTDTPKEEAKPKKAVKPARSRLERRGKNFKKSAEQIEAGKLYDLKSALELAQKTSHVKFDATVELHVRLNVDPRQADQNLRDTVALPAGTGKTVRVAVADDALLAKLDKGTIDFDVLVATPQFMPKLGKYARLLGPRGLMPNPKSGTVTTDVDKAVAEAKAGRVEYRVDSTGIVHLGIGKVSFTGAQLQQNADAVLASLKSNKPNSVKGNYLNSLYLTTSMGPSIKVDPAGAL